MADLGLSQLADEQLINLLEQGVIEVLSRDPILQRFAHEAVKKIAERREDLYAWLASPVTFMEIVTVEIEALKRQYGDHIRTSVRADIAEALRSGDIDLARMVGSAAESNIVVEVTKEQVERLKAEMKRSPEKSSFSITYRGGQANELVCSYHSQGENWDAKRNLSPTPALRESIRRAVFSAFGIPTE